MAAFTYAYPDRVEYKYRLLKSRERNDWIGPTSNREITFSNLLDGEYTFEFIANNGNDIWNKKPFQQHFIIKKPFWKKTIFWLLLISIITCSFLIYRLRLNRNKLIQQQLLREKLINVQEHERKRIAQELHDSIGQKIMLLAIQAKDINAETISKLALTSLDEIRNISKGLHPVILDQLGLSESIKDLLSKLDEHTDMFIDFTVQNVDNFLTRKHHIHVFRIIQELLNNCLKHANATTCSITIKRAKEKIVITVEDNGQGFEAKNIHEGMGLQSIYDRVKFMSGEMEVTTNNGAYFSIRIPMQPFL